MTTDVLCGHCFHATAPGPACSHCGHALGKGISSHSLPVGTVLDGKFVVGHVLGAPGGFGIAYLGWDRVLQRKVVIKELFPDGLVARLPGGLAVDAVDSTQRSFFNVQRELFLDEARKLARLDGVDAVARVIHYFAQNNTAYFVMPFVPGVSLGQRVFDAGRLAVEPLLQRLWPLAQGLQAVHELGLVHRDIKPENVLIDERDRPVLIDFGNAMALDAGSGRSPFFAVSRNFAAPEQYINDVSRTGAWTDIYAFGALLYFCLSGQRPTDAAARTAGGALLPLAQLVPGLPLPLLQAIEQAMALEPADRQASMADLLAQLEPLRPQAFHWVQALPANGLGDRMRRVHQQVLAGRALPRGFNLPAAALQGFWLFAHRLLWPGVVVSLFVLAAVALGLWFRLLPWILPLAWLLAALPCALYADAWQYRQLAALAGSLSADGQGLRARERIVAAAAPDARWLLLAFVPPLIGLLLWGWVSDYEEDLRYRVRQAVALDDLRARVSSYVADHRVPPQSLQDLGMSFVPNSEISALELKGGLIELVLAVQGADGRRVRWRLDPVHGWVCEARDLAPRYTPAGCTPAGG